VNTNEEIMQLSIYYTDHIIW